MANLTGHDPGLILSRCSICGGQANPHSRRGEAEAEECIHRCPFVSVLSAFGVFVCMEMAGCWGISEIILSINREAALLFSLTLFTFLLWFSCSIRVLPWMDSHTERIFFSFVLYILLYILRFIFHFIYCSSFPVGLLSWLRVVRQTECFCYN